jgi:hypothetical protein
VAFELAGPGLGDEDLSLAFGARVPLAEIVAHFFSSEVIAVPQQMISAPGAFTTITSVPHCPHESREPTATGAATRSEYRRG